MNKKDDPHYDPFDVNGNEMQEHPNLTAFEKTISDLQNTTVNRRDAILQPASGAPIWLISFTDVMALMLTFFVLIYSMINPERDIWSNITFSLKNQAGFSASSSAGQDLSDTGQRQEVIPGEDLNYMASILRQNLRNYPVLENVSVLNEGHRLVLLFPSSLLFQSGQYSVKNDVAAQMGELFSLLSNLPNAIDVYGYTDPEPVRNPRPDYMSNFGLAQQRAAAVGGLIHNTGYDRPIGLYGVGAGESILRQDYETMRRVEIIIHENRTAVYE